MDPTIARIVEQAKEETRKRIKADGARVSEPLRPLLKRIAKRVFDPKFNVDALKLEVYFNTATHTRFGIELDEKPWDYIGRRRMETARVLLLETTKKELPVWRISKHVGYEDFQNFSGRYRRIMGELPSEVRRGSTPDLERRRMAARAADGVGDSEPARAPSVFLDLLAAGVDELDQMLGHEETVALFRERVELGSAEMMERMGEQSLQAGRQKRARGVELAEIAVAAVEGDSMMEEGEGTLWRALGWARLGNARRLAADYEEAEGMIRRAIGLLEAVPWEERARGLAETLCFFGVLRTDQRRFEEARDTLHDAIAEARTAKAKALETKAWAQLAAVAIYNNEVSEARSSLREAHQIVMDGKLTDDLALQMGITLQLATIDALMGELEEAAKLLPMVFQLSERLEDRVTWHQARWIEAMVCDQRGDLTLAEDLLREARQGFRDVGAPDHAALASLDLALLCEGQGRPGEVMILASDALPVLEALHLPEALATFKLLRRAIADNSVTRSLLEEARDVLVRRI